MCVGSASLPLPSLLGHGGACAMALVGCGSFPWHGQWVPLSELSAERCGLIEWSHVSVGVESWGSANKGFFERTEYRGQPASKGSLFPQRKRHDFVPEEMSHLHSEARGVWKHGGTKFKSDLKSILKTRTDCTVFGTMISASKGCHQLFQKEIFELLTTRFSFLHCRWKSLLQRNIVIA